MLTLLCAGIAIGIALIAFVLLRALSGTASNYRESLSTLVRGSFADLFIFIDARRLWLLEKIGVAISRSPDSTTRQSRTRPFRPHGSQAGGKRSTCASARLLSRHAGPSRESECQ